ncbi:MAG: hypothetical protein M3R58_00515 [Pseudomonadota bacterium]|nr:hypothetical protein [Pseudomonadota bacterium]
MNPSLPDVRDFLAFLGIVDVDFVYAEGLALGDAPQAQSLALAHRAIEARAGDAIREAA